MTYAIGDFFPPDDGSRKDRIGRAEDRAEQESFNPGKADDPIRQYRSEEQIQRKAQQQRSPGQVPGRHEVSHTHSHAIGKEHAEQCQPRKFRDHSIRRPHRYPAETALAGDEAREQEKDSRRKYTAPGEFGKKNRNQQGHSEGQQSNHDRSEILLRRLFSAAAALSENFASQMPRL
jgi:hypothetical protein